MLWNGGQKERVKRRENYGLLIRQVVGGGARPFLFVKNTEKMIATAGANTITLEGKCLEDNMKAGLFDADGILITEAGTSGNADRQKL